MINNVYYFDFTFNLSYDFLGLSEISDNIAVILKLLMGDGKRNVNGNTFLLIKFKM